MQPKMSTFNATNMYNTANTATVNRNTVVVG